MIAGHREVGHRQRAALVIRASRPPTPDKRAYAPLQKKGGLTESNPTCGGEVSNNEMRRLTATGEGGRITP